MASPRIAVIGAGVMGCCTALFLSRGGLSVTLFDKAPSPMGRASRWNEGKIHLGHLYSGHPNGGTAAKVIPGGLAFRPLMELLLGESIQSAISRYDDIYLVHPESVCSADQMAKYFDALDVELATCDSSSYLGPVLRTERLSPGAVRKLASAKIEAGFRVPERSVNTLWIADKLVQAVARDPRISFVPNLEIVRVTPTSPDRWTVDSVAESMGVFDFAVNCAWESLLAIDQTVGLEPEGPWSHRHRLCLFVKTRSNIDLPSVVLATGPFGDIKNYDGRHFYMSWYPAGLTAEGHDVSPPTLKSPVDRDGIVEGIKAALLDLLPPVAAIFESAVDIEVEGGWVFAQGRGSLSDPKSGLHRRDRFGVRSVGNYFSADTGKYSTAPLLARNLSEHIISLVSAQTSTNGG